MDEKQQSILVNFQVANLARLNTMASNMTALSKKIATLVPRVAALKVSTKKVVSK